MFLLSLWARRRWERCRRECLEWILFPVGACYLYVALGSQRPERCIVTIVQSASRWPGVVQLFWCDIECRPLSVGTPEQDACFVAWSYQSNSPRLLRILAYDVCNTHFIWYWVTDWSFIPIHYSRLFHLIFVYLWDNFSSQKQTDTHMYLWQECAVERYLYRGRLPFFSPLPNCTWHRQMRIIRMIVHNRFNNSFHYIT